MSSNPLLTRPQHRRQLRWLYGAETLTGLGDGVFWVGLLVAISGSPSFNTLLIAAVVVRLAPRALLSIPYQNPCTRWRRSGRSSSAPDSISHTAGTRQMNEGSMRWNGG